MVLNKEEGEIGPSLTSQDIGQSVETILLEGIEAQNAAKHPTVHRTAPRDKLSHLKC